MSERFLWSPRRMPQVADTPEVVERIASHTLQCDEPEGPSREWLDARTELAREHGLLQTRWAAQQTRVDRERLSVAHRLEDAKRRAKQQRMNPRDVKAHVFYIEKALRKNKQPQALRYLERFEAILDRVPDEAAS